MRMIETLTVNSFKVTIFQTDQRYLLQAEDASYILSWKVDKATPYNIIKEQAIQQLTQTADNIWTTLKEELQINNNEQSAQENFPNII